MRHTQPRDSGDLGQGGGPGLNHKDPGKVNKLWSSLMHQEQRDWASETTCQPHEVVAGLHMGLVAMMVSTSQGLDRALLHQGVGNKAEALCGRRRSGIAGGEQKLGTDRSSGKMGWPRLGKPLTPKSVAVELHPDLTSSGTRLSLNIHIFPPST